MPRDTESLHLLRWKARHMTWSWESFRAGQAPHHPQKATPMDSCDTASSISSHPHSPRALTHTSRCAYSSSSSASYCKLWQLWEARPLAHTASCPPRLHLRSFQENCSTRTRPSCSQGLLNLTESRLCSLGIMRLHTLSLPVARQELLFWRW